MEGCWLSVISRRWSVVSPVESGSSLRFDCRLSVNEVPVYRDCVLLYINSICLCEVFAGDSHQVDAGLQLKRMAVLYCIT